MDIAKEQSLQSFRAKFMELVSAPTFGAPRGSAPDKESAAAKELRKTRLLDILDNDGFFETMYALSQECRRLESERPKVPRVTRRMRPVIHRYLSAKKRLETCARNLWEFDKKYGDLIEHRTSQKITSAAFLVESVASELDGRRKILVSNVHPAHRKLKDDPSPWDLLFKEYDFNLEKLGLKVTEQWFWRQVNDTLVEFLKGRTRASISAMTRFKLIAAISDAADLGTIPATTIKQFFFEHRPR